MTDFLLDDETFAILVDWLGGCDDVVCEAQYADSDLELAKKNYHTTVSQVASLAAAASVGRLHLFHLSRRYVAHEWLGMLDAARVKFPNTHFAPHWNLEMLVSEVRDSG